MAFLFLKYVKLLPELELLHTASFCLKHNPLLLTGFSPSQPSVPNLNFISSNAPSMPTSPRTHCPDSSLLIILTSLFSTPKICDYFILSLLILCLPDWIISFMRERLCLVHCCISNTSRMYSIQLRGWMSKINKKKNQTKMSDINRRS